VNGCRAETPPQTFEQGVSRRSGGRFREQVRFFETHRLERPCAESNRDHGRRQSDSLDSIAKQIREALALVSGMRQIEIFRGRRTAQMSKRDSHAPHLSLPSAQVARQAIEQGFQRLHEELSIRGFFLQVVGRAPTRENRKIAA
jgi:hypothetical protein